MPTKSRAPFFTMRLGRRILLEQRECGQLVPEGCDPGPQPLELQAHGGDRLLPRPRVPVALLEKRVLDRRAPGGRDAQPGQLLQQDVQHVQRGVAQMNRRPLVAVEVDERRLVVALPLQVGRVAGACRDQRHQRINAANRVVVHRAPLGDDVMAAAGRAAEQIDQAVSLAEHPLVRVDAVVRQQHEGRELGLRGLLDGGKAAAHQAVEPLERREVSRPVAIVVRVMVVLRRVVVQIAYLRVGEIRDQLPLELIGQHRAPLDAHLPLVEQLARAARRDPPLQRLAEREPAAAALEQLKALVALVVPVGIDEERDPEIVEDRRPPHVALPAPRIVEPEGDEIQVVVGMLRVPVELHVAADLEMLPGIEHRPRWPRERHAAHVEVREPRAAVIEHVLDPGQHAAARPGIAFADATVEDVVRQAVGLDHHEPFNGIGSSRVYAAGDRREGERQHNLPQRESRRPRPDP
jgi:hypothetical protein